MYKIEDLGVTTAEQFNQMREKVLNRNEAIDRKIAELEELREEKYKILEKDISNIDKFIDLEAVDCAISGLQNSKIQMLELLGQVREYVLSLGESEEQ